MDKSIAQYAMILKMEHFFTDAYTIIGYIKRYYLKQ